MDIIEAENKKIESLWLWKGMVIGMTHTPTGERVHIAFFGRRNAGKSSLMNAFTGQELSVVSPSGGTTTDAVYKAMELLPLGPVVLIDTPGLDDQGELGEKRVGKAREVMRKTDIGVIVADAREPLGDLERELLASFEKRNIPCLVAYNKADLLQELPETAGGLKDRSDAPEAGGNALYVSAKTGFQIHELKERVAAMLPKEEERTLVGDLVEAGDVAVLVVPVDSGAPKGRLILPQQQVLRDLLDKGAAGVVCRDTELRGTLGKLAAPPKLVITDSQVFGKVSEIVPDSVPLTSFSILMARYKGDLPLLAAGVKTVEELRDGDKVLVCEGCTHHRQCEDIGTVKIPNMIRRHTKTEPSFSFMSGVEFPTDVSRYKLVIHCGGCMLNRKEMLYRLERCREQGVPVVNYGVLLAFLNGIFERATAVFQT